MRRLAKIALISTSTTSLASHIFSSFHSWKHPCGYLGFGVVPETGPTIGLHGLAVLDREAWSPWSFYRYGKGDKGEILPLLTPLHKLALASFPSERLAARVHVEAGAIGANLGRNSYCSFDIQK